MFERIKGLKHVTLVAGHARQNMTSGIRKEMDSLGEVNVPDRISIDRLLIFYGSGRGLPLESAFDRRTPTDGPQFETTAGRPHTCAHTKVVERNHIWPRHPVDCRLIRTNAWRL